MPLGASSGRSLWQDLSLCKKPAVQDLRKDQKVVKESHEVYLVWVEGKCSVFMLKLQHLRSRPDLSSAWMRLNAQENLKQKRAFVQLEKLIQIKLKALC